MSTLAKLGTHVGGALMHAANTYPTLRKVIAEAIQNALDANAAVVDVRVDLQKRIVTVSDDGDGVSEESFNEAIALVHQSRKGSQVSKLGRFGIGLIAGLGKCESFTFTSRPKSGGKFRQWTFETSAIENCKDNIIIPTTTATAIDDGYSSQIVFRRIKKDRYIGDVTAEDLAEEIKAHYNRTLVRLETTVYITVVDNEGNKQEKVVTGEKYTGRKIEFEVIKTPRGKSVHFDLWISPRNPGSRPAGIVVGETGNDHTFSFSDFIASTGEWFTSCPDCARDLKLGIITGEIMGSGVSLHPNRKQFEQNEELSEFCSAIIEWYRRTGREIIAKEHEDRKDSRFQDIGRSVLKTLEEILPNFKQIVGVINSAKFGSIGRGHADPAEGTVLGQLPYKALRPSSENGTREPGITRNDQPKELTSDTPNIVTGPAGQRRNRVRGSNSGLIINFEPSARNCLWDFDSENATLTFNVAHPSWEKLEHSDSALAEMQLIVALMVLNMEGYRSDQSLYEWAENIVPDNIDLMLAVIGSKYPAKDKKKK